MSRWAYRTPAYFATWWGDKDIEIPLDSMSMDVRVGGSWEATVILGEGMPEFHLHGEYVEVDRPNRLVFTMTDEPGPDRETITVVLTSVAGGTEMLFSQTGGHLTPEQYEGTAMAWGTAFEALDDLLAG